MGQLVVNCSMMWIYSRSRNSLFILLVDAECHIPELYPVDLVGPEINSTTLNFSDGNFTGFIKNTSLRKIRKFKFN